MSLLLKSWRICLIFFFFFQAEDGIRDLIVTGVQTCALPICIFRRQTRTNIPAPIPEVCHLRRRKIPAAGKYCAVGANANPSNARLRCLLLGRLRSSRGPLVYLSLPPA